MRKQGVILEHITDFPLLRRQIDFFLRIKQHLAVKDNPPLIRLFDSGDTL